MSRVLIPCLVLLLVPPLAAQDKKPEPKGERVAGKVILNGAPLTGGTIKFISKDGKQAASAKIIDGSYEARVPAGEYRVAITGPEPKKGDPAPVKIPPRYSDPKTTPLAVTVKAGKQTLDFDLASK